MKKYPQKTNYNWYLKHLVHASCENDNIFQEAGWKENVMSGVLGAIILVMLGSTISNASKKMNVQEEQVNQAMQDNNMVDKAQKIISQSNPNENLLNTMSLGGHNYENDIKELPNRPTNEKKQKDKNHIYNQLQQEINIIARTIYAEGRGEDSNGRRAIATVIYNRGKGNPSEMIKAIKSPKQFSCWNQANNQDWTNMKQGKGSSWEDSMNIAKSMVDGSFSPIGKYDHYFNPKKCNPYWAYTEKDGKKKLHPHVDVGSHRFMTLNE